MTGHTKIVIHVEGGCLRSVYANHPVDVVLLDQDNYEGDSSDAFETEFDSATADMEEVW